MDYFAVLRAFVRAADLGSFSKAAAEDGMKVSTVSRYIAALESDLGAALFNRSTRGLKLTEVGGAFHARASRILSDLSDARLDAAAMNARPQGLLRVSLPAAFGRRHVAPHLPDFLAEYPDIRLDATLTDATVDLIATATDVAVRIGALVDSTLVAKRLAPHRRRLVASPRYLAGRAAPEAPDDLRAHECLRFALQPKDAWYFRPPGAPAARRIEVPLRGRLRTNDSEALLDAAVAGLGVALLPSWLARDAVARGDLIELLPDWEAAIASGPTPAIWAVYPPKKVVSPKVKAFLRFLERRFGRPPYWDRAGPPPQDADAGAPPGPARRRAGRA